MTIKIRKGEAIDDLTWLLMLFQIMIGNYLGIWRWMSIIVLAVVIISCIKDIKYFTQKFELLILFLCSTIAYPLYSYFKNGGDPYILMNNIYYIITPFALLLYMAKTCTISPDYTRRKLENSLPLLNTYALINIFVMVFQLLFNGNTYTNSVAYKDSISGLFGIYGQPNITLYASAIILLDFLFMKYKRSIKAHLVIPLRTMFIIIFVSYMILAALNDNKAFYMIFPLYAALVWFISRYEHAVKRNQLNRMTTLFFKILMISVLCIITLALLINYTFVGEFYDRIMHEINQGWNKTNLVQGSSERIGIISYALANPEMRYDGYGLATTIWKKEYAFGFKHFGQSDVGVFILLGGLLFISLVLLFVFFVLKQIFKYKMIALLGTIAMLLVGIYTQIFTTFTMMGCMILLLLVCWEAEMIEKENI